MSDETKELKMQLELQGANITHLQKAMDETTRRIRRLRRRVRIIRDRLVLGSFLAILFFVGFIIAKASCGC